MKLQVRTRFPLFTVGWLSLMLGAALLLLWYANMPIAAKGGRDLSKLWVAALWYLLGGAGVLLGNRVAALVVGLPVAVYWCWWLVAAIAGGHFLSAVSAVLFGAVCLAPVVVAIASWHLLGWWSWRPVA